MRIRYPQTFIATILLVAMACGPLAASVDSLQVTTSLWKRSSAEATFSPGQARLTLVFEKEMPAREAVASDEFEYSEDRPKVTAEVSYGKSAARALAGNVAGLEGVFTSSAWIEEDDTTQPTGDFAPDRPMARKKVLQAALGNALYRVWAPPAAGDIVPVLKALVTGDPVLYRMRRQYPAAIEVAGVKPSVVLFKSEATPDYFSMRRPEQVPDVAYEAKAGDPFILLFTIRHDELVFRKSGLGVASGKERAGVRVWLKSGKFALYADTDEAGVAEFDIGGENAVGEWRYQAGGNTPVAADGAVATGSRVVVTAAGKPAARTAVATPEKPDAAAIAEELAGWLARGYEAGKKPAAPPDELVCLLFGYPAQRREGTCWKADAYWLSLARDGAARPLLDSDSWLDRLDDAVKSAWVTGKASQVPGSDPAWSAEDAERLLADLRAYELEPTPERLDFARKALAVFFPVVVAAPEPKPSPLNASGVVSGHAMLALALFKAGDIFREAGYKRLAYDQVQHLLSEHVKDSDGSLVASPAGTAGDLRAHALVAQALYKAWRGSSKPAFRTGLDAVRKRVLNAWDAKEGGFAPLPSVKPGAPQAAPGKPVAADQFWALTVFADRFYPYWGLASDDWLR